LPKKRGLKYGVIGVGSMGKHHARIINSLPGVALVAISDINFASANELAKLYQAQAFSDYKQMFDLVEAV
jgi:virulence factor